MMAINQGALKSIETRAGKICLTFRAPFVSVEPDEALEIADRIREAVEKLPAEL